MPQKACERGFCHVMAFSQSFEMPQNRRISFSVHFQFCPTFSHFQNQIGKMGHFKKFGHEKVGHFEKLARDHFLNRKGTEN